MFLRIIIVLIIVTTNSLLLVRTVSDKLDVVYEIISRNIISFVSSKTTKSEKLSTEGKFDLICFLLNWNVFFFSKSDLN